MPIDAHHPFKGRQFLGEVIVLCVRWYLRYPLSYEHVAECKHLAASAMLESLPRRVTQGPP